MAPQTRWPQPLRIDLTYFAEDRLAWRRATNMS